MSKIILRRPNMHSRYIILLLLEVIISSSTLAYLPPELASSPVASAPVDIKVQDAKFVATKKPLTFLTPITEFFDVNNTGQSIDIVRINQHPTGLAGTVRGGILGDDIYVYFTFRFYFNNKPAKDCKGGVYSYTTINGKGGTRLEAVVFYYNQKYGSYEEALKHPDSILQISFRINVFDHALPNTGFIPLDFVLKKIQHPGQHHCTQASFTYLWFIFYPKHTIYYAYRSRYTDINTGKTQSAITIVIASNPVNYISFHQMENSFGMLKNCAGMQLNNIAEQSPQTNVLFSQSKEIRIVNVPG